ncbi:FGLLP motif-containing membrane protein [Streptodolium elevatio]
MAVASSRADRWKRATLVAAAALVLVVFWAPAASAAPKRTIILVVDTSDSMNEPTGNGQDTRLTEAKAALRSTIGSLADSDKVGLHEFSGECGDGGELLVEPATGNRGALRDEVDALQTNGRTPTPDAIRAAANEFPKDSSEKVLILVSDGESSCDEDPCEVVVEVQQQAGIKFVAHTVGFQTSDQANTELSCIADTTGGKYFAADDQQGITDSLEEALLPVVGGDVSTILNALPMPSDVPLDPESVGKTAGLAAGLVLLIGFPAELFNRTFEANQRRISRWWRRRGGGPAGAGGPNPAGGGGTGPFPPGGGGMDPGAGGAGGGPGGGTTGMHASPSGGMTGLHASDPGGMTGQHAGGGGAYGPGGFAGPDPGAGGAGAAAYGPGGAAGMDPGAGGAGAGGGAYASGSGTYGASGGTGAHGAASGSGAYGASGGPGAYGAPGGSGAFGTAAVPGRSLWASPWILPVFVVLSALASTFVDPDSGFNAKSGILLLGFLVAAPLVIFAYSWPNERNAKRASGVPGVLKSVPAALGLAIFCTVLSRMSDFVPGYVFGLVIGYVALRERRLSRAQKGKGVLFGAVGALLVSVAAWVGLEFVHEKAIAVDANVGLVIADTILGTTFILGVETVLFGLIPLRVLDGDKLRQWNTWVWAATYTVAILLFVHVLVLNSGRAGSDDDTSLTAALLLFAGFALVSGLFWAYFKYVPDPALMPAPAGMPVGAARAVPPRVPPQLAPYMPPPPPGAVPGASPGTAPPVPGGTGTAVPPPPVGQPYVPPPGRPQAPPVPATPPPPTMAPPPPPPAMPPNVPPTMPGHVSPPDAPPPPAGPPPGTH